MSEIKIEISSYKEVSKGALKAYFSVIIHPQGEKLLDCRYFVSGDQRWFSFPCKEIKYNDGRKSEYIPYISYLNKEYFQRLKNYILDELVKFENQGQCQAQDIPNKNKDSHQGNPQPGWF